MSKLVQGRRQSQRKDSEAKKSEISIMADKLIISPEYKWLKKIAANIASEYRTIPGTTANEEFSYQVHCHALYFYNKMFAEVEKFAKLQRRRGMNEDDSGWN
jgi:hypothetical protein